MSPNAYSVFPIAAIGGLLAGLCLAYLAGVSDKSFRTPAEIRRRLGLPVIGHIPFFAAGRKGAEADRRRRTGGRPDAVHALRVELGQRRGVPQRPHRPVLQHAGRRPPGHPGHQPEHGRRQVHAGGEPGGVDRPVGQEDDPDRRRLPPAARPQDLQRAARNAAWRR